MKKFMCHYLCDQCSENRAFDLPAVILDMFILRRTIKTKSR